MFWRKKKKEKYKPTGRIGVYRVNDYPYVFTIAMEKICEVGDKSRVKVLEVGKACDKTDLECLRWAKFQDWVNTSLITWETDGQYHERINRTEPLENEVFEEPQEPTINYTPHTTNPFRHVFVENERNPVLLRPPSYYEHEERWEDEEDLHIPF